MKNVMKLLVAGMMLVAGSFVSMAQPGGGRPGGQGGRQFDPAQMAQRRADMMKETVKLTDEQYAKVLALYKEESEAMQKQMQSGERPRMDREAMQKQREEQDAKLKAILTEEQFKTWTEAQQNRMLRGMGGPGGPGGGRPRQ
jgi:Spy/CpxP family protein refolding chaperone